MEKTITWEKGSMPNTEELSKIGVSEHVDFSDN